MPRRRRSRGEEWNLNAEDGGCGLEDIAAEAALTRCETHLLGAVGACLELRCGAQRRKSPSDGCVLCDIVDGRAPAFIVAQNDLALAILDIHPLAAGHCLVLPRRHVAWWDEMEEDETDAVFRLARTTAAKIRAAFDPDCVTMYARGRRIPHTHIFLLPTRESDPVDRLFNALEAFQERAADLGSLWDPAALEAAFDNLKGS